MKRNIILGSVLVVLINVISSFFPNVAVARTGMAEEKAISFQPAASEIMNDVINLHSEIFYIITGIVLVVLAVLLWTFLRYNKKANPKPSQVSHNTWLEIVWTLIPVLILAYIGFYSVRLLYKQEVIPDANLVIKVTGHQWYWTYEYLDSGLIFDSNMLPEDYFKAELSPELGKERAAAVAEIRQVLSLPEDPKIYRLLDTDRRLVVPIDTTVKVIVTADDVIHSWTVPAFGFKIDAIPGRLNETWFRAREEGVFYGQCSELCGIRHAYMPIAVQVVSQKDFELWQTKAKYIYMAQGTSQDVALATTDSDQK